VSFLSKCDRQSDSDCVSKPLSSTWSSKSTSERVYQVTELLGITLADCVQRRKGTGSSFLSAPSSVLAPVRWPDSITLASCLAVSVQAL
jgi:hypothetical protein